MQQQAHALQERDRVLHLVDIQSQADARKIAINQVGVSDLRYPAVISDIGEPPQSTIAQFSLSVGLPEDVRGTHMSRFVEILHQNYKNLSMRSLPRILKELQVRLKSTTVRFEAKFPYFIEQAAPVSGMKAVVDYGCWFIGDLKEGNADLILGVSVPVTSLCPCSKAISDYGAHNQRGNVDIEVRTSSNNETWSDLVSIKQLVNFAYSSGSSPIYSLLKRDDERHVTMRAYDNPAFVEDIVRNVGCNLNDCPDINWFKVSVSNQESIHNHNAFATIEVDKRIKRGVL